jgi:hypothetical protein
MRGVPSKLWLRDKAPGPEEPAFPPLSAGVSEFPPLNASHTAADGCASPPSETCSTHHLLAASTTVRARFSSPAILTSVAVWDTAPSPPLPAGSLANMSISVGRDATVTNCALHEPPPPSSDPASDPAWMPGFARKALLSGCRTPATFAAIRIVRPATAGPPAAFAVKICISRLDAAATLRDGTLWLQEAPP